LELIEAIYAEVVLAISALVYAIFFNLMTTLRTTKLKCFLAQTYFKMQFMFIPALQILRIMLNIQQQEPDIGQKCCRFIILQVNKSIDQLIENQPHKVQFHIIYLFNIL